MKISSSTPSLTPEARSFLESLEFRVKSDYVLGSSILSMGIAGDSRDFAPVELLRYEQSRLEMRQEWHMRHYGIMERPYRDLHGDLKLPRPPKDVGFMNHELGKVFAEKAGRPATDEESRAIQAHIIDQANRSPFVNSWAEGIDFVALHGLPFDGRFETGSYSQYSWLAGSAVDAQAMKRFIVEHPVLAGVATSGGDLFEVAGKAASPEAAYEAVVAFVVEKGFPCSGGDCREDTPPVPRAVLDRLKGVPAHPYVLGEENISDMVDFLKLAVRLDPETLPRTLRGIDNMSEASKVIGYLGEDLDVEDAIHEGYGFGLTFTDEEVRSIFRGVDFDQSDVKVSEDKYDFYATNLGIYGAVLAGQTDPVNNLDDADFDFSALKEALIRDGYVVTAQKAHEAVLMVANAKVFAP